MAKKNSKDADNAKLRGHIHELRAALRTTDAKVREMLSRQQYFPSPTDEAILDNNAAVLLRWEQGLK